MKAAIITVSTEVYEQNMKDQNAPAVEEMLSQAGFDCSFMKVLPQDQEVVAKILQLLSDERLVDLVITMGGTGIAKDDCVPEATKSVLDRELPGVPEAIRFYGMRFTKQVMFSRGTAGIRKETIIVNLPGEPKQTTECLDYILSELSGAIKTLAGEEAASEEQ